MRRSLLSLVLLLVLALVAAGCGQDGAGSDAPAPADQGATFPVTLDTPAGKLTLEQQPARIVSMSPTATEMLFAIGAGKQVAAVDSNSNYPEEAPRTDLSAYEPNVEAVAGFKPDLVVYSDDPGDLAAGLGKLAIPALQQPAARTLDDTYAQLDQLGRATGHLGEATQLAATMRAEIARIAAAKPAHQLTYYHELDKSLYSATSKTFIGQLYAQLGMRNIADAADKDGSGYPQLSAEYVVKANPDLIFLADTKCCAQSASTVAARDGWGDLTAVRTGGVVELDDDVASRWGPRVVDFLKTVAAKVETLDPAGS
ncbi:MAG TPA: ABC transporter substrate-binding protein [Actinomycetota bacterium]|nr:ABC transporter substrate-binding protein [Actinomycetota bacterium]